MNRRTPFYVALEAWMQWAIVTGFAVAIMAATSPAVAAVSASYLPSPFDLLASAVVSGALIGLIQWAFLRLSVTDPARWAIVSGIGCAAALTLIALTSRWRISPFDLVFAATLSGLVLGYLQSLVLAPANRRGAWVLSTVIGWGAAALVASPFTGAGGRSLAEGGVDAAYSLAAGWVLLAIVLIVAFIVCFPKPLERDINQPVKWLP